MAVKGITRTFRLLCSGLIATVPKRVPGSATAPDEVLLAVPNLRLPMPIRVGSKGDPDLEVTPPPHVACLVVERRYVDSRSTLRPDLVYERYNRSFALYSFAMHNVRLQRVDGAGDLEFVNRLALKQDEKPAALVALARDNPHDLRWVPPMAATGVEDAEVFDRAQVDADDLPREDGNLIGTITLEQGTFRAADVYREDDGTPRLFRYATIDGDTMFEQPLARGAELVLATSSDTIELIWRSASFEPGEEPILRLRALEDSTETLATFYNRELEAILGVGEPTTPRIRDWDTDPAILYGLSRHRYVKEQATLPVTTVPNSGRDRPGCDPLSFSSWA